VSDAAEFFLETSDPDRDHAYRRFVELFDRAVAGVAHQRHRVPYRDA
jgi:hypothetical protein